MRSSHFSSRTPESQAPNRLTRLLSERTAPYLDLTVSNPTAVSLAVDVAPALVALGDARSARYEPDPRGLLSAREAVSAWYAARGAAVDPSRIVLTASSSEAYAWLFALLAEPGDTVLVPSPSYPLLDPLAELAAVRLARYRLPEELRFAVQADEIAAAVERETAAGRRVAAVVLVDPNNPTGTTVGDDELAALSLLAARRRIALVSDEVFRDFRGGAAGAGVAAARRSGGLVFSLGGLSKSAALPQVKLGWIAVNGPEPLLSEALERLAWIADTFLSVSTPAQLALPALLAHSERAIAALSFRLEANRSTLEATFPPGRAVSIVSAPAGWSAVLRVPAVEPEEEVVLRLLDRHGVLVHPGYFFDFPHEAFLVLSLLPDRSTFAEGVERLKGALGG